MNIIFLSNAGISCFSLYRLNCRPQAVCRSACEFRPKGDIIADLTDDMTADDTIVYELTDEVR